MKKIFVVLLFTQCICQDKPGILNDHSILATIDLYYMNQCNAVINCDSGEKELLLQYDIKVDSMSDDTKTLYYYVLPIENCNDIDRMLNSTTHYNTVWYKNADSTIFLNNTAGRVFNRDEINDVIRNKFIDSLAENHIVVSPVLTNAVLKFRKYR